MTQEELTALKEKWRRLVVDDIGAAIQALKEALPGGSDKEDVVLSMEGRLNDLNRDRLRGLIDSESLQRGYNRLRAGLLDLITGLEVDDFKKPGSGPVIPKDKTGHILYQIPNRMQLEEETRCVVRLAYEEASLIRNIELTEDTNLQSLRISQVMQVALVDPNSEETFRIRTLSGEEQFIERGDYTEWIYFVTPLKAGTFPLVLKVSVIALIMGKERKKDIVLEESVEITAVSVETQEPQYKSAAYLLTSSSATSLAEEDILPTEPPVARRTAPSPARRKAAGSKPKAGTREPGRRIPVETTPLEKPRSRRSMLRPLAVAASILLVATVALNIWMSGAGSEERTPTDQPSEPGEVLSDIEKSYLEVRLLIPPSFKEAEIWVNGRQIESLSIQDNISILELEQSADPFRFELRIDGQIVCRKSAKIVQEGQLVELDCLTD